MQKAKLQRRHDSRRMIRAHSPAIRVTDLTHIFPRRSAPVLQNVSFSVHFGEWLTLVGPNEVGKSTLIRILATLITPTAGRVEVCGHDVLSHSRAVRRCVGALLDSERSFYYRMTAYQNLAFFAALYGWRGRHLAQRVDVVLDAVDLAHVRDVHFMKFSAGMRRRLALARAILSEAPVMLLDEPTAHLDPEHARTVLNLIAHLRDRGHAVLTTAHSAVALGPLPDTVLHLRRSPAT